MQKPTVVASFFVRLDCSSQVWYGQDLCDVSHRAGQPVTGESIASEPVYAGIVTRYRHAHFAKLICYADGDLLTYMYRACLSVYDTA